MKLIAASNKQTKNTKWYNNGVKEIRFKKEDAIPDGFYPGRIKNLKK